MFVCFYLFVAFEMVVMSERLHRDIEVPDLLYQIPEEKESLLLSQDKQAGPRDAESEHKKIK